MSHQTKTNKNMKTSLGIMAVALKNKIELNANKEGVFNELFKAYNRYVEDETDGGDYIFNIEDKNDLSTCVNAGMTAVQIFGIVNGNCKYFLYGQNHTTPYPLTFSEVEGIVRNNIDEVIRCILAYPYVEEYRKVYTRFVTNTILEESN